MTESKWPRAKASFHRAILVSADNAVLLSLEAGICAAVFFTTALRYPDMRRFCGPSLPWC